MAYSSSPPSRSPRLHSLDALRGLDMLIILGLDALVLLLASRNPESAFLQEAARQMTHARWEGLHLYDLVFPVFVFISGVSMSFSLGKYTSGNASSAPGLLHLWKRALVLAFLGLLVNGTLTWTDSMRYASVLGLIGFSCAMQVQAFRKVNGYAFASTMCIGNLRSGVDAFCAYWDTRDRTALRKAGRYFAVILIFALGAGFGGVASQLWGTGAIWASCLLLAVSFLLMFRQEIQAEADC